MVAHGLITGLLFFVAGSVQERYKTREMTASVGLADPGAELGWILGFTVMASRSAYPAWPDSGASSPRSCPPTTRPS